MRGEIDLDLILGLDAYSAGSKPYSASLARHLRHLDSGSRQPHLGNITSLVIQLPPLDQAASGPFDELLRTLLWENRLIGQNNTTQPLEVLRCKGLVQTRDGRAWGTSCQMNGTSVHLVVYSHTGRPRALRDTRVARSGQGRGYLEACSHRSPVQGSRQRLCIVLEYIVTSLVADALQLELHLNVGPFTCANPLLLPPGSVIFAVIVFCPDVTFGFPALARHVLYLRLN